MNMPQAMSFLRQAFPDYEDHSADSATRCTNADQSIIDVFDFACYAAAAFEKHDDHRVRTIFNVLESLLAQGASDTREWVSDAIEAMQGICAWRSQAACTFDALLGPRTRILWDRHEFIRRASSELDLSDCSVFEAEILTWRFVREKRRSLTAA